MSTEEDIEAIIMDSRIFHAMNEMEGMIGFIATLRDIDPGTVFLEDEDMDLFEFLENTSAGAFASAAMRELDVFQYL